jgi:hypothetical protein
MAANEKACTTRREFVERLSGTIFAGALVGIQWAKAVETKDSKNASETAAEKLVAVCGLYCGACPMYLATQQNSAEKFAALQKQFGAAFKKEDLLCDGCLGGGRLASFCRKCAMRDCAAGKNSVKRCSDCSEFACSRITNFNNDGMQHHSEVLANLRQLKTMGIKKWTLDEQDRWLCAQCKTVLSWYDPKCPKCSANRSERLFPLKKG